MVPLGEAPQPFRPPARSLARARMRQTVNNAAGPSLAAAPVPRTSALACKRHGPGPAGRASGAERVYTRARVYIHGWLWRRYQLIGLTALLMLYAAMSRGRDLDKSLVKSVVSLQKKVPVVYALAAPRRRPSPPPLCGFRLP